MDDAYIPEIIRTELEHRKPFTDPNSVVSKSGLELLQFEVNSDTWQERYIEISTENISPKTQSGKFSFSHYIEIAYENTRYIILYLVQRLKIEIYVLQKHMTVNSTMLNCAKRIG